MLCSPAVRTRRSALAPLGLAVLLSCGGETEETPPPPQLEVWISDAVTGGPIAEAYLTLSSGGVFQPMRRTDATGRWTGEVSAGVHELRVAARGYHPSPAPFRAALAAQASAGQTARIEVALDPRASSSDGLIEGRVTRGGSGVPGVLVTAAATVERAGLSDGEGRFVLLDLPLGDYRVEAHLGGHVAPAAEGVRAGAGEPGSANLELAAAAGVVVSGTLGAGAGPTRVGLAHGGTGEPVPGLEVAADSASGFSLGGVPPGRYRVRAFLEEDAQVLDPDLIRQREDLELEIQGEAPPALELPVAPSMLVLEPSASSTVSADASFRWSAHPDATFYVVEVRNVEGQLLWGGFDAFGSPKFRVVGSQTSIRYGAQGNPTEDLRPGHAYDFRVYAGVDVTTGEIFKLVGASEELTGRFRVSAN